MSYSALEWTAADFRAYFKKERDLVTAKGHSGLESGTCRLFSQAVKFLPRQPSAVLWAKSKKTFILVRVRELTLPIR